MRGDRERRGELTPLGSEVERELRRFGPQAGLAEVVSRWPEAVGPPIARFAWPARIGRDGTVHVHTADSTWAFELAHRAGDIAGRLGVDRLRFSPGPLPEPGHEEEVRRGARPAPEHEERARRLTAGLADENLREIVTKAIAFGLAAQACDRSV